MAESRALATLELLAGLRSLPATTGWVLIEARFEPELVEEMGTADVPDARWSSPPPRETQPIGDLSVRGERSAVLRIPSVLVTEEFNYLLNPAHPDFASIRPGEPLGLELDPRLER